MYQHGIINHTVICTHTMGLFGVSPAGRANGSGSKRSREVVCKTQSAVSGFALRGFRSELLGDPERFDEEGKTDCDG